MNEAEAKTKWCPEARVGSSASGNGSINRDWAHGPLAQSMCLGHGCMMFVPDREAFNNAMYEFEESSLNNDGDKVVPLKRGGADAPPPPQGSKLEQPDIRDFYKCGKVFPDIL